MTPVSSPLLATGSLTASHGTDREKLAAAARQFEAIFLRQMLAAARKADFGGEKLLGGQGLVTQTQRPLDAVGQFAPQAGVTGGIGCRAVAQPAQHPARPVQ